MVTWTHGNNRSEERKKNHAGELKSALMEKAIYY